MSQRHARCARMRERVRAHERVRLDRPVARFRTLTHILQQTGSAFATTRRQQARLQSRVIDHRRKRGKPRRRRRRGETVRRPLPSL